jgi:hypothetical protein
MSNLNAGFVFKSPEDSQIEEIFKEFDISGYDMLRKLLKEHKSHKCNNIPIQKINQIKKELSVPINIKETDEYKSLQKELFDLKNEKRKSVYYDASDDIKDNNDIIKLTSEISKLTKIIEDNQINHKKEVEDLKIHYDGIIFELKKKEISLLTPSNSDNNNKRPSGSKNKFDDKSLNILERCKVYVYKYDKELIKENDLHILEYIASENKFLIRFNSIVAEKVNDKEDKIWEKLYYLKVKDGELIDYPKNKQRFKYKYLRCKELYDLYGENLKRFKMNIINIGKLTDDEWKNFIILFDKLYNDTFKNIKACKHKYNDDKICGIYDCNIRHREIKKNK